MNFKGYLVYKVNPLKKQIETCAKNLLAKFIDQNI